MRLGEHDVSTTEDGKHEDIGFVAKEKHEQYVKNMGINDIGIIYLKKDVKFNGK